MQIDRNDEHPSNAFLSIRTNREFDSNVTTARESHMKKQNKGMILVEAGMQTDMSDEHSLNAYFPIRTS
jgi:hypothetical protein